MSLLVDDLGAADRDWARALNNAAVPAVNDLDAPAFAALARWRHQPARRE